MFDLGWSEMALILVVALIVVGPKDLPRLARTLGQWVAKGRSMAREFQRHIDDMAREADLQDLKDSVGKISPAGIRKQITDAVDPDGTLAKAIDTREIKKSFDVKPESKPSTVLPPSPVRDGTEGSAVSIEATKTIGEEPATPVVSRESEPAAPPPAEPASVEKA